MDNLFQQRYLDYLDFYVSSNNPKNVHATNEIIPTIRVKIAKMNFPKKRIAIALVMKVKETAK